MASPDLVVFQAALGLLHTEEQMAVVSCSKTLQQLVLSHHGADLDGYTAAKHRAIRKRLLKAILRGLAGGMAANKLRRFAALAYLPALCPREEVAEVADELMSEGLEAADVFSGVTKVLLGVDEMLKLQLAYRAGDLIETAVEDGFIALCSVVAPMEAAPPAVVKARLEELAALVQAAIASLIPPSSGSSAAVARANEVAPSRQQVCAAIASGEVHIIDALQQLCKVLFTPISEGGRVGLRGNTEDYDSLDNVRIDHVLLHSRKGLPITLCAIFEAVARRAGIPGVRGVSAPGHFVTMFDPASAAADVAAWIGATGGPSDAAPNSAMGPASSQSYVIDCFATREHFPRPLPTTSFHLHHPASLEATLIRAAANMLGRVLQPAPANSRLSLSPSRTVMLHAAVAALPLLQCSREIRAGGKLADLMGSVVYAVEISHYTHVQGQLQLNGPSAAADAAACPWLFAEVVNASDADGGHVRIKTRTRTASPDKCADYAASLGGGGGVTWPQRKALAAARLVAEDILRTAGQPSVCSSLSSFLSFYATYNSALADPAHMRVPDGLWRRVAVVLGEPEPTSADTGSNEAANLDRVAIEEVLWKAEQS